MTPQIAIQKLIEAGWTEARIAREVGVSQPTVHRIKHGQQRRGASFDTCANLIRLASLLEVEGSEAQRPEAANRDDGEAAATDGTPVQPVSEAA